MRFTGTSSFLPDSVRGTAGTARIASGTCRGDSSVRSAAHDARRAGRRRASAPGASATNSSELAHRLVGVVALEVHDEAVGDLGQTLDDRVEVAGAEAHATAVERGVGATGDHARAVVGERDPVAVAPHARVVVEVRVRAASRRRVAPEPDRHRRHRLGDDELALHAGRAHGAVGRRTPRPRTRAAGS